MLDESGSLGPFLENRIARVKQMKVLLHLLAHLNLEKVLMMTSRKLILNLTSSMMTSSMNALLLMILVLLRIFLQKGLLDINYLLKLLLPLLL